MRGAWPAATRPAWTALWAREISLQLERRRSARRCRRCAASCTEAGSRPSPRSRARWARLALERQAQLEELGQLVARQERHARPAVGLDAHEALDLQLAQGGAQRVAGDLVGLDELALDQPLAGLEVAGEDALAQDARSSWSTVEARRSAVAFMPAARRGREAPATGRREDEQPAEHEQRADPGRGRRVLAERDDPEHRGGERLGEDDRGRLAAGEVAQAAREEHVGQRGGHGGQVGDHRQPAGRGRGSRGRRRSAPAPGAGRRRRSRPP